MSRLLALEWDAKEARVVVGRKRGVGLVVEQAFTLPLPVREEGSIAEPEVGAVLAKGLAERGLSRSDALVAVGRASIELRFLTTPPVPEEELPEIVRFQAMRQFTTLGEEWPLDFVPLTPNADGGMNVLAAAIDPNLVEQIRKACENATIRVNRLVLRPFAAASLLKDQLEDGKCRMIVDLLRDDADLTVLIGSQVIFPRTVRLPLTTEADVLARTLLAEGRRTSIAAQNQLGGRRVEEIIIFGDSQHHTPLKQLLEKELGVEVRLVDPFERIEWSDARTPRPEFPGTFAPLLGILQDEATGHSPVIDFLHPRKKPPPPNQRRKYIIGGSAAAAAALVAALIMQIQLWSLDSQIAQLRSEKAKQKKMADDGDRFVKEAKVLDEFAAGDIAWIDELHRLSEKFPPPEAARVRDITADVDAKGGRMKLMGHADTFARVGELEDNLRDEQHVVSGRGTTQDDQSDLPWTFEDDVTIASTAAKATAAAAAKTPAEDSGKTRQGGGQ